MNRMESTPSAGCASAGDRDRRKRPSSGVAMEEENASAAEPRVDGRWKRMSEYAARVPQYRYKSIADARKDPGVKVWLFAVVSEIGPTIHSRGTDFFVTLRIADRSCTAGISVTFFAEDTARLPCVKSNGDVISLHNVLITPYGEDFCVKFNKYSSSFALFEREVSAECCPYQICTNYPGTKRDRLLLTQTRTWIQDNSLGLKDLELQLSCLKSDSTFDLVCKVVHVLEHNGEWIFYVWDGTDTPAAEFQAISDAVEVQSPCLLEGPPLPRGVLCTMPCVGTVLRIFSDRFIISDKFIKQKISHMQSGTHWARFCNITCNQESGTWKGILQDSSRVHLLSLEDVCVVDRLKMYETRNARKVNRRPMKSIPSNVTGVDHPKAAYATLMRSLTHGEVTHKLKTLVRVVGADPCRPSEVRLLSTGDHCMMLTLEDPTARIHAFVHMDEMAKFFGFLSEEVVVKKMNKLLGNPEPEDSEEGAPLTRNPPWVWCCLKSYYTDENDPWGSRTYQIFDTEIRD